MVICRPARRLYDRTLLHGDIHRFGGPSSVGGTLEEDDREKGYRLKNITLRRNVIRNAWSPSKSGHSQGIYAGWIDGLIIEENVLDHNGWNDQADGGGRTMFNHNIYFNETHEQDGVQTP